MSSPNPKRTEQIEVEIFGQFYRLACSQDDQNLLIRAAELVDQKMRVAAQRLGRSSERVAVMAGLGLALELLDLKRAVRGEQVMYEDASLSELAQTLLEQTELALARYREMVLSGV